MPRLTPDQSFYPSPSMAMAAAPEKLAYVAMLNPRPAEAGRDGRRGRRSRVARATASWSARSTCPTPATSCTTSAGTPAARACARTRRTRTWSGATWSCRACDRRASTSSTPSPIRAQPQLVKVIEPDEVVRRTGYSRPHTAHCGPDGIYLNALGVAGRRRARAASSSSTPRRSTSGAAGKSDRGPQHLAYDFWWHLGHDTMITSEWGTPNMVEERRQPRAAARRQVRPRAARVGPAQARRICRSSISAPSSRWCSSCGRRTIRPRPTASSASSCR